MRVQFPDGRIEVIISTGYVGKSDSHPEQKGSHCICTENCMYWSRGCEVFKYVKILRYSNYMHRFDRKKMKRSKFNKQFF